MRMINKDNIVPQIISYEDSKHLPNDILRCKYLNLAVIFWEVLAESDSGYPIADYITVKEADFNNIEPSSQLVQKSVQNMITKYPINIKPLSWFLDPNYAGCIDPNYARCTDVAYVMRTSWTYGAAAMFDKESLETFCHECECERTYILTSSIYEVLLIPDYGTLQIKDLFEAVEDVNGKITQDEKLIDSVYLFDADANKLLVAAEKTDSEEIIIYNIHEEVIHV